MKPRHLLAVLVLVSSLLAVPMAVADAGDAGNAPTDETSNEYTLDELREDGRVVDERFHSLRVADETTAFWIVRYPPSGLNTYGEQSSQSEFLEPSTVVRRSRVRMFGTHKFDGETRSYNLTLVYWNPETRQIQTENGTTSERFANISAVGHQQLEFDSGMQQPADVHLRQFDKTSRVTVFMNADGTELKWTFKVNTIATATPVNINSMGDLYRWVLVWIVAPSLVVAWFVGQRVPKFRRAALAGPGYSAGLLIAPGVALGIAFWLFGYVALSSLVVAVPLVFPLMVGWILAVILLTDDEDAVETWGFVRLDPETATSPIEDKAEILDSADIEIKGFEVVFTPDEEPALYHGGLLSMWARYRGKFARLNIANKEAEWNGHGDYDKVIIVSEDAPELVTHLPERVIMAWPWRTYQPPRDDDGDLVVEEHDAAKFRALPQELGKQQYLQIAGVLAVPVIAAFTAQQYVGSWIWGPLACLPLSLVFAKPIGGEARTEVAPGQARKAWTTAWYTTLNMRRFSTIQDLMGALIKSENKKYDVQEWLDEAKDEGLISEAHDRTGSPFESVLSDNDPALDRGDSHSKNGTAPGGDD